MKCGLLGEKLGHSYSPQIHNKLADYDYSLFEVPGDQLETFLKNGDFTGLNVTIPYKKAVIPYLQELSPTAARLGAVNTIVRRKDGTLFGHNTDYFGFHTMAKATGISFAQKKALVLGSGGAAVTAAAVLRELGCRVVTISRTGENNYTNLHLHQDAAIIVNATPVGMYPNNGLSPVDLSLFPKLEGVLDLIFNPARTKLLMDAEERGCIAMNGLLMLVAQAKESAECFTGCPISKERIRTIYEDLIRQIENIVLVGMPGCGKTAIGQALARKTGRKFVDADDEIQRLSQKTIPEIFNSVGEAGFRELETQVLAELGKGSGLVISTGGGCVTREENYRLLHQNGKILWVRRELSSLATAGRPLSQTQPLAEMYRIREPMYRRFADLIADNNASIAQVADIIIERLEAAV